MGICLIFLLIPLCIGGFKQRKDDTDSKQSETWTSELNQWQIRAESTLHIHEGETLVLQCRQGETQVLSLLWQTPFGVFEDVKYHNKDQEEISNGTLRILRATSRHNGLYVCFCQNRWSKSVVSYRVSVVDLKANMKVSREVEIDEGVFVAAVCSSVIVSFCVAFTLGALSRAYVIGCLQRFLLHMPFRNRENNTETITTQSPAVLFKNNVTEDDDKVDFGVEEHNGVNADDVNAENGAKDESTKKHGELTKELKSMVSPHPKKKIRVIKLYNYDEDGNRFSHIKESETNDDEQVTRSKVRTRSLTRLDAIMKQAEHLDVYPHLESKEVHWNKAEGNCDFNASQTCQEDTEVTLNC